MDEWDIRNIWKRQFGFVRQGFNSVVIAKFAVRCDHHAIHSQDEMWLVNSTTLKQVVRTLAELYDFFGITYPGVFRH